MDSSINYDLREADLIALFSVFGPVVSCDMTLDNNTGKHKGFCFIQYSEPAHAEAAMTMDGFQVGGRKVSSVVVGGSYHCHTIVCSYCLSWSISYDPANQ